MIQRIQTIYLILVFLLLAIAPNFIDLWTNDAKTIKKINDFFNEKSIMLISIPLFYYASAITALITVFLFKNRKLQFVLVRLNMLINLLLLGLLIYVSLTLSGEEKISEKGIGMFIPVIAILLLVLANKAIKKDEDLVKSVDRIR